MGDSLVLFDQNPSIPDIRAEVVHGLGADQKRLSPKYFYDQRGSELFDEITRAPEYYLTRTEVGILKKHRDGIATAIGSDGCVIEYGSGTSAKIRILLDAAKPRAYVPVDISKDHLLESAQRIADDYPDLGVHPTCADYSKPFELPPDVDGLHRMAFFPGSSIGNFERESATDFISGVREVIGVDGLLLIGVDAKKAPKLLNAAYNDARGVTEAFNLNILEHLNDRIGTDFDVHGFEHFAQYNSDLGRIEMHLVSVRDQEVSLDGQSFGFTSGERIHTENSYKYDRDEFIGLAKAAGFECRDAWVDPDEFFMVFLLAAT